MSIPHLFRCPITLDIFTDPVTLSTGQTYDRSSIEKWLADGNRTCPVTMQVLADTALVPNHTLRHLIDKWLNSHPAAGSSFGHPQAPINSVDDGADFSLAALKHNIQSPKATRAGRLASLKKVRVLSVESDVGQACLVQWGFLPLLLQQLCENSRPPAPIDSELAEVMLESVRSLSSSSQLDELNMLIQHSNMSSLVHLLDQGNMKVKTNVCRLLEVISSSPVTQELCLVVGHSRRVLQILVSLLHNKSDVDPSEAAVRVMAGLCALESNRSCAIREGAVGGLLSHLSNSCRKDKGSRALSTLELLLGHEAAAGKKAALIKNTNAVRVLVKMVFGEDREGSEHALGALLVVCCESEKARSKAVNAGVLTQILLLLQSQCSSKARTRATVLLKLLRPLWTEEIKGLCL